MGRRKTVKKGGSIYKDTKRPFKDSRTFQIPNGRLTARTLSVRKKKHYEDILGRPFKTETFGWDGVTVYSTLVSNFNGRDQVTLTRQYAGNSSSSTFQDTAAAFDAELRLDETVRDLHVDADADAERPFVAGLAAA